MRQIILTIVFLFMVQWSFGQVKSKTKQKAKSSVNNPKNKKVTKPYLIPRVELESPLVQDTLGITNTIIEPATTGDTKTQSEPSTIVQVQAIFAGGESKFREFVYENFVYPTRCSEEGERVVLRFVVDETGKISNVKAIDENKVCPEFTAEAIRVIKKSPRWIPAQNNGKFVKSFREIPISFYMKDMEPESNPEVPDSIVKDSIKQENTNIPQNASDAIFPGGNAQFGRYIMDRIVFPIRCKLAKINGRVMARFIVNVDGSVSNVEILEHNYMCPEFSKEAIRVIIQSPKWTPATIDGKPVKCYHTIPIKFVVEEE